MVHGNYYGVQYEIYLNKELDLFDDILPICIGVRKMISLERISKDSNKYKLVIIPCREFDGRFEKKEHARKYMNSLDSIRYNHKLTRKTNPEDFVYYDVKNYETCIKHLKVETYTEEMIENLEIKLQDLISKFNEIDYWNKYSIEEIHNFDLERSAIMDALKVQRIIRNKEYFDEIKQIEHELTDIELTDAEKELIQKVLSHPKLNGVIQFHGINLIESFY